MTELKPRIHDESNGLDYVLVGDYYVPDLKLPEEHRPIGMWGRLHRTYLELILSSPKPTNLYRKRSDRYFLMKCLSLFIYQTLRRKTQ